MILKIKQVTRCLYYYDDYFSGTSCPVDLALSPAGPLFCSLSVPMQVGARKFTLPHTHTYFHAKNKKTPPSFLITSFFFFLLDFLSRRQPQQALLIWLLHYSCAFVRMGWIPPLQREKVHRLRWGPSRDRGRNGPCHRSQQRNFAGSHQPACLLPSRYMPQVNSDLIVGICESVNSLFEKNSEKTTSLNRNTIRLSYK